MSTRLPWVLAAAALLLAGGAFLAIGRGALEPVPAPPRVADEADAAASSALDPLALAEPDVLVRDPERSAVVTSPPKPGPGATADDFGPPPVGARKTIVRLPDDTGSIEGSWTTNTGAPVAGEWLDLQPTEHDACTSADGRFVLERIDPGSYVLVSVRRGIAAPVTVVAGATAFVSLVEPRTVEVSGKVVTEGGSTLEALVLEEASSENGFARSFAAFVDGIRFSVRVPPGSYRVVAAIGFPVILRGLHGLFPVEVPTPVEWRITVPPSGWNGELRVPTGSVLGRVVAQDGTPIADASVMATGPNGEVVESLPVWAAVTEFVDPQEYAFEPGQFRLRALGAGTWRLRCRAPGYVADEAEHTVLLRDAEGIEGLELVVGVTGTLEGTVVDEHGSPMRRGRLLAWNAAGEQVLDEEFHDWRFRVAARGPEDLWLASAFDREVSLPLRCTPGSTERLVLRKGTTLWLTARATDGAPRPAAFRVIDSAGREWRKSTESEDPLHCALSAAPTPEPWIGHIGPLPPGTYRVLAEAGDLRGELWTHLDGVRPWLALDVPLD